MNISDLIAAAGPLSDIIEQIVSDNDEVMMIATKNNTFLVEMEDHRIIFQAAIDTPIETNRDGVLTAMLTYNAVWKASGHVRLALTGRGADSTILMIADVILNETFTPEFVAKTIESLDAKIEIWRELIKGGADDGSGVPGSENSVRV